MAVLPCTVLSNAFLVDKTTTMRTKGGNTTELYGGDGNAATRNTDTEGRRLMAESLALQHDDVAKVGKRFGRAHHIVNYKPFSGNTLVKVDPTASETISDYGLKQEVDVAAFA